MTKIWILLSLAAMEGWITKQVDFSNAFAQATMDTDVYVEIPQGFASEEDEITSKNKHVLKLNKSLYGLVQAPFYWNEHL